MPLIIAALASGLVFGWGLLISGMMQPAKVLGFLDIFGIRNGTWDPTLAFVMGAALVVTGIGFALTKRHGAPLFAPHSLWPTKTDIDTPLVTGAVMFGVGWGLVGLCPGPALENLATLSMPVIVFVVAMAAGMLLQDLWQNRREITPAREVFASSDG
jgi:uncharacterized membrane protein YedE/YeeE